MKERTKAYFAGLVDAEGSIYVYKGHQKNYPEVARYSLVMSVANDSLPLMKWIQKNFGGTFRRREYKGDVSFEWVSQNLSHIGRVLDLIIPYLMVKKSQALLAKDFINLDGEMNPKKREEIRLELERLKSVECVTTNTLSSLSQKLIKPYMAGFIDGESYIRVYKYTRTRRNAIKPAYQVKLAITNTEKKLLEYSKELFGGAIYTVKKQKVEEKQRYSWEVSSNKVREKILLFVLPYLIVKRSQALLALQFLRIPLYSQAVDKREQLYQDSERLMIESKLAGDSKSEPAVT